MPIYLPAPQHRPKGPDGQGWNRLSLNTHIGVGPAQCALKPRSHPALWEAQDSRRARWGPYGPCLRDGDCLSCPILTNRPRPLTVAADRVLVRLLPGSVTGAGLGLQVSPDRPCVMAEPAEPASGCHTRGEPWSWAQLARVPGWQVGRAHHDEHGHGFWLERACLLP